MLKLFNTNKRDEDFKLFINRAIKAKDIFYIREISKSVAYDFVRKYHYLGDAKFFAVQSFGLFYKKTHELIGCAAYSLPQGTETLKSWFGLGNDTKNIYELSRLCVLPNLNGSNATSFLLSGSIKELNRQNNEVKQRLKKQNIEMMKDDYVCRGVITLACSERHVGSIYQVCNFKYYGLTKRATDFYSADGRVNPRGKIGSVQGVYLPRSRKHRYAYILDNTLEVLYEEQERPNTQQVFEVDCCNGTNIVYDDRYNKYYTCPRCCGKIKEIEVK
jgi:hypothetical protein